MEVRKERTGWRDEGISRRHRLWGVTCAATDIDFILVEYNSNTPKAIVEYKNEHAKKLHILKDAQCQVLKKLGDLAQIPVIGARYVSNFSRFTVVPMNQLAKNFVPTTTKMVEAKFVELLYRMRGINSVPRDVLETIKKTPAKKAQVENEYLGDDDKEDISEQLSLRF